MSSTTGRRKALSLIAAGALALAGLGAATIPAMAENAEDTAVGETTASVEVEDLTGAPGEDLTSTPGEDVMGAPGEELTSAPVEDDDAASTTGGGDKPGPGTIDYCDYSHKKVGGSVASWLASAPEGANTDCIDVHEVVNTCGFVQIPITSKVKPYSYQIEYWELDADGKAIGKAKVMPEEGLTFAEDYNGGSVTIRAYIGGPEQDWVAYANEGGWKHPGKDITVITDCVTPAPVNYCDPGQRPAGVSIGDWLKGAPGDSKTACMTVGKPVISCGAIDIPFESSVVGLAYQIEYWELGAGGKPVGKAKVMPEGGLTFAEGYNDGSVTIQAYVGGPEQDYVRASSVGELLYPGAKFTVKTSCETTPPTEEPTDGTEKPTEEPTTAPTTPSQKPSTGDKLPPTGSNTAPLAASALMMLGLGAVAVAARSRRTAQ